MGEVIGKAKCPECGETAKVCEDKLKKLYLNCECGIFKYQSKIGQERLRKRFELFSDEPAPSVDSPEVDAPEISESIESGLVSEVTESKPRKNRGFFGKRRASR